MARKPKNHLIKRFQGFWPISASKARSADDFPQVKTPNKLEQFEKYDYWNPNSVCRSQNMFFGSTIALFGAKSCFSDQTSRCWWPQNVIYRAVILYF